jgi:hypothetical protein
VELPELLESDDPLDPPDAPKRDESRSLDEPLRPPLCELDEPLDERSDVLLDESLVESLMPSPCLF